MLLWRPLSLPAVPIQKERIRKSFDWDAPLPFLEFQTSSPDIQRILKLQGPDACIQVWMSTASGALACCPLPRQSGIRTLPLYAAPTGASLPQYACSTLLSLQKAQQELHLTRSVPVTNTYGTHAFPFTHDLLLLTGHGHGHAAPCLSAMRRALVGSALWRTMPGPKELGLLLTSASEMQMGSARLVTMTRQSCHRAREPAWQTYLCCWTSS